MFYAISHLRVALLLDQVNVFGQGAQLFEQRRQVQARRHQHRFLGGQRAELLDPGQTLPVGLRVDAYVEPVR